MPTIGQPGRVASDKNTAQEILDALTSDSTQFNGADIDASISSRATPAETGNGVDWSSKTPKSVRAGTDTPGTFLSVSGSGYILDVVQIAQSASQGPDFEVDNVTVFRGPMVDNAANAPNAQASHDPRSSNDTGATEGSTSRLSCIWRFESGFSATSSGNIRQQIEVSYVLD